MVRRRREDDGIGHRESMLERDVRRLESQALIEVLEGIRGGSKDRRVDVDTDDDGEAVRFLVRAAYLMVEAPVTMELSIVEDELSGEAPESIRSAVDSLRERDGFKRLDVLRGGLSLAGESIMNSSASPH